MLHIQPKTTIILKCGIRERKECWKTGKFEDWGVRYIYNLDNYILIRSKAHEASCLKEVDIVPEINFDHQRETPHIQTVMHVEVAVAVHGRWSPVAWNSCELNFNFISWLNFSIIQKIKLRLTRFTNWFDGPHPFLIDSTDVFNIIILL